MDKIEINFSAGISGIVGPNGCGKSNIADAIRWCIGEQSPSMLRGKSMEDVIFGGAGELKPMGMAEVSIIFEKGMGLLPEPYSMDAELSITRRLYRTGESEYFINGIACRLKDITGLFMDTGLGNRSYSIISQGRISNIIEQRPEETRIMLEEAAGITKLRKQVTVSLKKIEQTESNLSRLEDIINEVNTQMSSLKKQAVKAKRYKTVSDDIRRIEMSINANLYMGLSGSSEELQQKITAFEQLEISASVDLVSHKARLETMLLDQEVMDTDIATLRYEYGILNEKSLNILSDLQLLEKEKKLQSDTILNLEQELLEIKEKRNILEADMQKTAQALVDKKSVIEQLEKEVSEKKEELVIIRSAVEADKAKYDELIDEKNERIKNEMGLKNEMNYLSKDLALAEDKLEKLKAEIEKIKETKDILSHQVEQKAEIEKIAILEYEQVTADIEAIREKEREINQIKQSREKILVSAEKELRLLEIRLEGLQYVTESYDDFTDTIRMIMTERKNQSLGVVADFITVPEKYEKALSSVLDDRLKYIVTPNIKDAMECIALLKKDNKGRAYFLPMSNIKDQVYAKIKAHPTLPMLKDFVLIKDGYFDLLEFLLGDVVLADNFEEAVISKQELNYSFVTTEGDFIDHRGLICGGGKENSFDAIFSRRREIEAIIKSSEELRNKVFLLREQFQVISDEMDLLQESIHVLISKREKSFLHKTESEKDFINTRGEFEKLIQMEKTAIEEQNNSFAQHSKQIERLSTVVAELSALEQFSEEKTDLMHEIFEALHEKEMDLEFQKEYFLKLQADIRVAREEMKSLERDFERINSYASEFHDRFLKAEKSIFLCKTKIVDCTSKSEKLEKQKIKIFEDLKVAEEQLSEGEKERNELRLLVKEEERKLESLRSNHDSIKEKLSKLKADQSGVISRIQSLIDQVYEQHNENIGEVYVNFIREDISEENLRLELKNKRDDKIKLGEVNLTAITEYDAMYTRFDFLSKQKTDLLASINALNSAIKKINRTSLERFKNTFQTVNEKLSEVFPILFGGGQALLKLMDEDSPLESGVFVEINPPGKKLIHMGLLSGGEKALAAMALLFAIYMVKPSPFCFLDEVDAPLDDANIDRFNSLLKEINKYSQIIMITHSRRTMEIADRLFGITMERPGVSKTVSVEMGRMTESLH